MTEKLSNEQLARNAKIINEQHHAILNAEKGSFELAVTAGRTLKACKDSVGHGDWLDWLAQNCPGISTRTAQEYMQLARKEEEIEKQLAENGNPQHAAHLSIRYAKSLLAPKPQSVEERKKKKAEKAQAVEQVVNLKANELAASMAIEPILKNLVPDEVFKALIYTWDEDQVVELADQLAAYVTDPKAVYRRRASSKDPAAQTEPALVERRV